MSLVRTALRLVAIEAIRPTASLPTNGPWPTIARHRVYDAKIDQIDDLAAGDRAPIVAVYTDEDESNPAQRAGGPPFQRFIDLCFELSVAQMMADPDNPEVFEPAIPVTDPESEASLDLLDASIRFALIYGPTGSMFRKLTGSRIHSIKTIPSRTSEEAIRLSMRSMTMRVEVQDDCYDLAPTATATGLDRLPEPLRSIIAGLPDSSYGSAIGAGLAEFAPTAPVPTRPFTVKAGIDVTRPDQDGEPDVIAEITPPQS